MDKIKSVIAQFRKVSLSDLDKVELMNRVDLKFCFHFNQAHLVFESIKDSYSVLEIEGESIFNYYNTYYDTIDNQMYLNHHNGKLNRYKIRVRRYDQTNNCFLEIKFKNNKGRTIKKRMERSGFDSPFNTSELDFVSKLTPFSGDKLSPKIINTFNRITLVNNSFTERVTIDFAPGFKNGEKEVTLHNLVIVEIKQNRANETAQLTQALRSLKVEKQGFSKYCIGRSLTEDIKQNNFKPLLLKISKEYSN